MENVTGRSDGVRTLISLDVWNRFHCDNVVMESRCENVENMILDGCILEERLLCV
jgi:hypothetical protein